MWQDIARVTGFVLAIAITAPVELSSQPTPREPLLHLVERAVQRQEDGRFRDAQSLITQTVETCTEGRSGSVCRQILFFGLGYIAQREAERHDTVAVDYLRQARAAYVQSLHSARDEVHRPTLDNLSLVYARLGPRHVTRAEIYDLLWLDPARASQYRSLLGDRYRIEGKLDTAYAEYSLALQEAAVDPAPLLTLSKLTAQGDTAAAILLERLLPSMVERFPDASAEAYRVLIWMRHDTDSVGAAAALTRWVELQAKAGRLSEERLLDLPVGWRSTIVTELRAFVQDTAGIPPSGGEWMRSVLRRSALARAGLSVGMRKLEAGTPRGAEIYWTNAFRIAVPGSAESVDIARELATLYARYPRLDPDGVSFKALESALVPAKPDSTSPGGWAARQRFHGSLGMIYADRQQWRATDGPGHGAIGHLERALSDAARHEQRERFYQPLPALRARLAEGYAAIGDTTRAVSAYVAAARAYMDIDNPDDARRMLENVPEGDSLSAAASVRAILRSRFDGSDLDCDTLLFTVRDTASGGVSPQATPAEREFVLRQRFKIAADCAVSATDSVVQARFAAVAVALALWGQPGGTKLGGGGDLQRFERSKDLVRRRFGLGPRSVLVLSWQPSDSAAVPTLAFDEQPRHLVLERGSILAARLASVLPANIGRRQVRIERRGLVLIGDPQDPELVRLSSRLEGVEGVRAIRIETP